VITRRCANTAQVLYVAVSDTPAWFVAQCQTLATTHALSHFVCYQGRYSAMDRDAEGDLLPMCDKFNLAYVPWSVLGAGKLATKDPKTSGACTCVLTGALAFHSPPPLFARTARAQATSDMTEIEARVHKAVCEVADRIGKPVAQVCCCVWCVLCECRFVRRLQSVGVRRACLQVSGWCVAQTQALLMLSQCSLVRAKSSKCAMPSRGCSSVSLVRVRSGALCVLSDRSAQPRTTTRSPQLARPTCHSLTICCALVGPQLCR
jgi:hypothetical protein